MWMKEGKVTERGACNCGYDELVKRLRSGEVEETPPEECGADATTAVPQEMEGLR